MVGVNEWLDEQKGVVTKDDLLQHIGENEVSVQEVMKGPRLLKLVRTPKSPRTQASRLSMWSMMLAAHSHWRPRFCCTIHEGRCWRRDGSKISLS